MNDDSALGRGREGGGTARSSLAGKDTDSRLACGVIGLARIAERDDAG